MVHAELVFMLRLFCLHIRKTSLYDTACKLTTHSMQVSKPQHFDLLHAASQITESKDAALLLKACNAPFMLKIFNEQPYITDLFVNLQQIRE